jgi:hypothetical protein
MTWTAPKTWVANTTLTAAELNAQIRDNLNHQAAPIVSGNRGYVVSTGENDLAFRQPERAVNQSTGETSSTSYTDLDSTDAGPVVTATTGTAALIIFGCTMIQKTVAGNSTFASVAVSGATTISPSTGWALRMQTGVDYRLCASQFVFFNTLNPGDNTFTMKYAVGAGKGEFKRRRIMCLPF